MDAVDLSAWIGPVVLLITLAMGAILAAKGPTRALKIGVVVLLLGFVAWMGMKSGWTAALTVLSVTLGVTLLSMGVAVRLHQMPLKKELRPVDEQSCPRYGAGKLRDWTRGEEFFHDPQTLVNRVGSRATCADLYRSHEEFVLRTPGGLVRTEDPVSVHIDAYHQWIARLLDSAQLVVSPDAAVIPLRLTLPTMFRVLAAWFH